VLRCVHALLRGGSGRLAHAADSCAVAGLHRDGLDVDGGCLSPYAQVAAIGGEDVVTLQRQGTLRRHR
jgi:hypothetical protein